MNEIFVTIIIFLANIVQALTGFAGTLLAMPLTVRLIGIDSARIVLNFMGLFASAFIISKNFKHINIKEIKNTIGWLLFGMAIAYLLYETVDRQILTYAYGVMIILIALKKMFIKKEFVFSNLVMKAVIVLAGIIQGLFASGGALLVIYLVAKTKDKNEFRATASMIWILLNGLFIVQNIGNITSYDLKVTAFSLIPLFLGVTIGSMLHRKISQEKFMKIAYILLLLSGMSVFI